MPANVSIKHRCSLLTSILNMSQPAAKHRRIELCLDEKTNLIKKLLDQEKIETFDNDVSTGDNDGHADWENSLVSSYQDSDPHGLHANSDSENENEAEIAYPVD